MSCQTLTSSNQKVQEIWLDDSDYDEIITNQEDDGKDVGPRGGNDIGGEDGQDGGLGKDRDKDDGTWNKEKVTPGKRKTQKPNDVLGRENTGKTNPPGNGTSHNICKRARRGPITPEGFRLGGSESV